MNDQLKCVVLKCSQTNVRFFFVQTVSDSVTQLSLSTDLISRPHIHTCIRTYVRTHVRIHIQTYIHIYMSFVQVYDTMHSHF